MSKVSPNLSKLTEMVEQIDPTKVLSLVEKGDSNATNIIMDAEDAINSALTEIIENEDMKTPLSKLLIRVLLRKCQVLGKDGKFEQIIEITDEILLKLNEFNDDVPYDYRSNIEATALGYKGFSLMKMNKINEAIVPLTKSYELKTIAMKGVALVDEQVDKKKFNQREKKETIQVERALVKCLKISGKIHQSPLPPLIKFSRTVHLFNTGGTAVSADDLVMSSDNDIIYNQLADGKTTLYIEEKIDGANFGLSLGANGQIFAQNRSHYVTSGDHAQFSPLAAFLEENRAALTDILSYGQGNRTASQSLILYGEWVVAKHSIPYHRLPGHFIAFDIYDRKVQRFWSRERFHNIMRGSGIPVVPMIKVGNLESFKRTSVEKTAASFKRDIVDLLDTPSDFRIDGGKVEGIILRIDGSDEDNKGWLKNRLKVVRPDFVAGCQEGHWSRRDIDKQTVDYEFAIEYLQRCYVCADTDAKV